MSGIPRSLTDWIRNARRHLREAEEHFKRGYPPYHDFSKSEIYHIKKSLYSTIKALEVIRRNLEDLLSEA